MNKQIEALEEAIKDLKFLRDKTEDIIVKIQYNISVNVVENYLQKAIADYKEQSSERMYSNDEVIRSLDLNQTCRYEKKSI